MTTPITIRPATKADVPAAARLAAMLVRQHQAFDPLRFFVADNVEAGYAWWFDQEVVRDEVVLLIAEQQGTVVGYCYGRLEERDWNQLLDACGAIHDIWVEEDVRGGGVATQLIEAAVAALRGKGAPRIVLHTAQANDSARRLFERLGFRRTMVEMTRECGPSQPRQGGDEQGGGEEGRSE